MIAESTKIEITMIAQQSMINRLLHRFSPWKDITTLFSKMFGGKCIRLIWPESVVFGFGYVMKTFFLATSR